jgi:hypothetical protein
MTRFLLLIGAVTFLMFSPYSFAAEMEEVQCGSVKKVTGVHCPNFEIDLDLSQCTDAGALGAMRVECVNAYVSKIVFPSTLNGQSQEIEFALTKNSTGEWVAGTLYRKHLASRPIVETSVVPSVPGAPAQAVQALNTINVSGNFLAKTITQDKVDMLSNKSYSFVRIRPQFMWNPSDQAQVILEPQASKIFGEQVWSSTSATGNTQQSTSGKSFDTALTIHQAYGVYRPFSELSVLIGRQVLEYGEGLVVGASDWNSIGQSFDAARVRLTTPGLKLDVLASKLVDTNTTTSGAGDKDLYGIYPSFNFGEILSEFDLYGFYLRDKSVVGQKTQTYVGGVRAKNKWSNGSDVRLEITRQNRMDSFQGETELGLAFDEEAARVALLGFYAEQNYNPFFHSGHKFLGIADIFTRKNIKGLGLKSQFKLLDDGLVLTLDYTYFRRVTRAYGAYSFAGNEYLNTEDKKDLGSELDITLKFKLYTKIYFTLGGSYFHPTGYFKNSYGRKRATFYYGELLMSF